MQRFPVAAAELLDARVLLSGHNEAPFVELDAKADLTDVYAFTSASNPNAAANLFNFVLNVNAGAQYGDAFGTDINYEIVVDRDGDLQGDLIYRTTFGPQQATGKQSVQLDRIETGNGTVTPLVSTRTDTIGNSNNFTSFVFAGLRADSFFGSTHDLRHLAESGDPGELTGTNEFAGQNVHSIAVQVPLSEITDDGANPVVNVYARTTDREGQQLDRAGRPLFQPLILTNAELFRTYLATGPAQDQANFQDTVTTQIQRLSANTYADAVAEALAALRVPDVLTVDTTKESNFPNGRKLANDVIDAELAILTNGRVTSDGVGSDDDFSDAFPYISDVNLPDSPLQTPTIIADPAGDASTGRPDVIRVDAASVGSNLYIDVTFTSDTVMDDLRGVIGLDTDQNASTGSPFGQITGNPNIDLGVEAVLDFSDVPGTGLARVSSAQFPQGETIPAQFDLSILRVLIPRELLSNFDRKINIAGATANDQFQFDDYFPNSGSGTIVSLTEQPAPEIELGRRILFDDLPLLLPLPDETGSIDLGTIPEELLTENGDGPVSAVVTIENTGTADLELTQFSLSPALPGLEIFVAADKTRLAPGESTDFEIGITAGVSPGPFSGTVSITNNDADESEYNFSVIATIVGNSPPTATADEATTNEETPITINVLENDSDVDGDLLTIDSVATAGVRGMVTLNSDGTISYDPRGAFEGLEDGDSATESFTYVITDGRGATATGTVAVTVTGVDGNQNPVATDDSVTARQGERVVARVLDNDFDPDGDPVEVFEFDISDDPPVPLTVTNLEDGTLVVEPLDDFFGTLTISYAIRDNRGGIDEATLTIEILRNQSPVAVDDTATTQQGQPVTVRVVDNDSDPEGDPLSVVGFEVTGSAPAGLELINNDDSITVEPPPDFAGIIPIRYRIRDSFGDEDTAVLYVTVEGNPGSIRINAYNAEQGQAGDNSPDTFEVTFTVDGERVVVTVNNTPVLDRAASDVVTLNLEGSSDDDDFRVNLPSGVGIMPVELFVNGSDGRNQLSFTQDNGGRGLNGHFDVTAASASVNGNQIASLSNIQEFNVLGSDRRDVIDVSLGTETGTPSVSVDAGPGNDLITLRTTGGETEATDQLFQVLGGDGVDRVDARSSSLSVFLDGGEGPDVLLGGTASDTILGGAGSDIIRGGAGDDQIDGDSGNDVISGGLGDDLINGGEGNDLVNGDDAALRRQGGNDTINGGPGIDILRGWFGDDTINGGEGNDILRGDLGNDTIRGEAGNDIINGWMGNDVIDGGVGNDILLGEQGDDEISDPAGNNLLIGGAGNDVLVGGVDNDSLFGNQGDDQINDPSGRNHISGGGGDDLIRGGTGNDTILGDSGDDDISDPAGRNVILGGTGNDRLRGGSNRDLIFGGLGNDLIDDLFGQNLLFGGPGDNVVNGRRR